MNDASQRNGSQLNANQVQQCCAEIRRLLQKRLGPSVSRVLDDVDTAIFALASAARAGTEEQRLLDALRELRRQRTAVEHGFQARLGLTLGPGRSIDPRRTPPLSLFARDELEERLSLAAIAKAVSTPLHAPLYGLNCRLAVLVGAPRFDDQTNPIGPLALAEAFRDAFLALDVGLDLRLLAYRKLQERGFEGIGDCYARCNAALVAVGVLPELPLENVPASNGTAQVATPDAEIRRVAAEAATAPVAEEAVPERQPNIQSPPILDRVLAAPAAGDMAGLFRLLLARRADEAVPPVASLRGLAETREVPRERLLDATAELLRDARADPRELKRRLLDLAQLTSPTRVALSAEDEGTVDLVDALFERMSRDDVLPTPLCRALKALRVPFLNAALRDQSLIDDPAHPARQLIDEFSDSARGWSVTADPGQRLLRQMQAMQALLRERRDADGAGFDAALTEFREFVTAQRTQAEQAELRAIESTRSREALHQAQIDARLTLDARMAGFTPSPWLRQLLERHWSPYVVLVLLRHGLVSDHYRQALAFADAMLTGERDSTNPIHAASFRARRLELESQLRQGLATLAYSDEDIVRLCGELHGFILVGASQSRTPPRSLPEEALVRLEDQPRPERLDPGVMRHLRGLRQGTWFELGASSEDAERGRLSWISPLSGRWMLVNWAGRKVADMPPERMAEDIARGLARVIGDANLLRRAVDAVMSELQQGADPATPAEAHGEA